MTGKKRSAVWMYFEKNEENSDKSLCQICSGHIQSSGGNTSNMLKHLRNKHPVEYTNIEEMRKMEPATSSKKIRTSKKRKNLSEKEGMNKQISLKKEHIKREVRVQYGDQEMSFVIPNLKISDIQGSHQKSTVVNGDSQQFTEAGSETSVHELEVQSHAAELSFIDGSGNHAFTGTNGETVFVARKRTEWQDLFHESLRPHLRDMDRQQQRQYISRVSQAVMEILNSSGSPI